ncbi:MAG: Uncharacterized protein G01um101418_561 [Parcubacteria group bacterium Gr01-1014_18]|nr:MAG: Uncharacterized protein Greene041636_607 [Parcubacteria group bacterium Greene0416_36]TSC80944.1 MAG: Uncharacterized protein G01um101418_561 [Parcubacteria group bacterium Gr01-1014_18]TSC98713.1 MAG: Uncharacterized protein Greene101420_587 [Parcubacteria group bacterium Greene1014_20]TSD06465.1 MAG: Uncharacterized protein Greene07142_895 [Parcubacteria group bacterium Greene0714_2]
MDPQTSNIFQQYANIFIPLGVSLISTIGALFIYKEKICNLEKNVAKLLEGLQDVRDKAIACEATIKANEPFLKRKSPISLSERGVELLEKSGGKKMVDENLDLFTNTDEFRKIQHAYDLQEYAFNRIKEMKEAVILDHFKDYLFREGLQFEDAYPVMGVYLRDILLKKKNLNVEDIDAENEKKQEGEMAQK